MLVQGQEEGSQQDGMGVLNVLGMNLATYLHAQTANNIYSGRQAG